MSLVESPELPPLATVRDVSAFTKVSLPTLARYRADGTGPRFIRIGRSVRYRREDVLAWLDSLASGEA
ncbi:helix-turn-helix transcriptional regulator [Microbacterium sp.]|uniref:helix-turn-helix transcriptional regulator n=1 Tax=Microbacterium sp. TaxID=51671 RepID=UPI00281240A2|nr:helix-turn-helix domain-containing protein [Microbacterium sp.]